MHTTRKDNATQALSRNRGIARAVHYDLGGTPAMWLGAHTVTKNHRKANARRACRGRHWHREADGG